MADADWPAYLESFHAERAGITEDVLEHVLDATGRDPYGWAAQHVPAAGTVLDLACGSAPLADRLPGHRYLGVDLSAAELAAAGGRGAPVARADARRLPLADGSVDAVVMSMALMLVPLHETLCEVRRVLRPRGVFVATVPHNRPLPPGDWLRYARLCLALRHPGLSYPNDDQLARPAAAYARAGLRLERDESRAFRCQLREVQVADRLLASLYLPDVAAERMSAGRRVVRRWTGKALTTPIRLLLAFNPETGRRGR